MIKGKVAATILPMLLISTALPAVSAFFALFDSCSVTCIKIMETISPIFHLTFLACDILFFLPTLLLMHARLIRSRPLYNLFRQPRTWIVILKSIFDFSLIILLALNASKVISLNNGKSSSGLVND